MWGRENGPYDKLGENTGVLYSRHLSLPRLSSCIKIPQNRELQVKNEFLPLITACASPTLTVYVP